MITYSRLIRHSEAACSLIGMSLPEFDALYAEFEVAHSERLNAQTHTQRTQQRRRRAVGGGRAHTYPLCDRLLMTLFWLRAYTTYAVLGFLYELDVTRIEDNLKEVLATLDTMASFSYERPGPGGSPERRKLRALDAVMDAFPAVRLVIDAREQRTQRPKAGKDDDGKPIDRQKPYYSGKKKTHTLKNQIAVAPDGTIEAVSASVPGGSTHDLTLLRQTQLLEQLGKDAGAMLDKGYDGIRTNFPDKPLFLPFKARRNHPLTPEQKAFNSHLARYRIVVEHTIAQVNRFQAMRQVWRHLRSAHTRVVRIVCALVNRQIAQRPLKSYATA